MNAAAEALEGVSPSGATVAVTTGTEYGDEGSIVVSVTAPEENGVALVNQVFSALAIDDVTAVSVGGQEYTVEDMTGNPAESILGAVSETTLTGLLGDNYGDASHTLELHFSTLASNGETYSYIKTFTLTFHMDEQVAQNAADAAAREQHEAVTAALAQIPDGEGYTADWNENTVTLDITRPKSPHAPLTEALEGALTQGDAVVDGLWEQTEEQQDLASLLGEMGAAQTYTVALSGSKYGVAYENRYAIMVAQNEAKVDAVRAQLETTRTSYLDGKTSKNGALIMTMEEDGSTITMRVLKTNEKLSNSTTLQGTGLATAIATAPLVSVQVEGEAETVSLLKADGSRYNINGFLDKLTLASKALNIAKGMSERLGVSTSATLGEILDTGLSCTVYVNCEDADGIRYQGTWVFTFEDGTADVL